MSNFDEFSRTKYCAMLCLNRRMHTRYEMVQKLLKKGYSADSCERTVDFLIEAKYIDDKDYAIRYTKDAVNLKKYGIIRIKQNLRQKGISQEIIDEAISDADIDTSSALEQLICKKKERLDIEDPKQKKRLIDFLIRKGYKYSEINAVISKGEFD